MLTDWFAEGSQAATENQKGEDKTQTPTFYGMISKDDDCVRIVIQVSIMEHTCLALCVWDLVPPAIFAFSFPGSNQ